MPRTFTVPEDATLICALLSGLPGVTEIDTPPAEKPPILPPAPDVVALAMIQGMLASGRYGDDPAATIGQAWAAVAHFYLGRQDYANKWAPLYFSDDLAAFATADDLPDADDLSPELNPEAQNQ